MRSFVIGLLLASCTDSSPRTQPEPELTDVERAWIERALPVMEANCIQCHASEDPSFLAGTTAWEIRDTLLASGVVDIDAPPSSFLLSKGAHSGPSLTSDEMRAILDWLAAEAAAL